MDRGPLNYDTCGIIKHRICVENVPGVELLEQLSNLMGRVRIRDIKFAFV